MTIEINEKEYELIFGLKFIRLMDEQYARSTDAISIGRGISTVYTRLQMSDPVVCFDIVRFATVTQKPKIKDEDLESWLEEQDIDELCENFTKALAEAPLTKGQMKKLQSE